MTNCRVENLTDFHAPIHHELSRYFELIYHIVKQNEKLTSEQKSVFSIF